MDWNLEYMTTLFSEGENSALLSTGYTGLEKESLRVTPSGDLALTPHPPALGDKMKNPLITTDFAESQLEFITQPFSSNKDVHNALVDIQNYGNSRIGDELLWPLSMPARLPSDDAIPIARYDGSEQGNRKEIYREGLAARYGKKMQTISGIHYNYSYNNEIWDLLKQALGDSGSRQDFINKAYFHAGRNILRNRWLLLYLFGASPVAHDTFTEELYQQIEMQCGCSTQVKQNSQYITSLRNSGFGYSGFKQENVQVSFNSLDEYIGDITRLMYTQSDTFTKLGLYKNGKQIQLNTNILQIENEFYAPIRFKRPIREGETNLGALNSRGVEYIELRTFDIDPFASVGISLETLDFTEVYMAYSLLEASPAFDDLEIARFNINDQLTALLGRKKGLELYEEGFKKQCITLKARTILEKMKKIALIMDKNTKEASFTKAVEAQIEKINNPSLLPSEKIISEMEKVNGDFIQFGLNKAKLLTKEDSRELSNTRI